MQWESGSRIHWCQDTLWVTRSRVWEADQGWVEQADSRNRPVRSLGGQSAGWDLRAGCQEAKKDQVEHRVKQQAKLRTWEVQQRMGRGTSHKEQWGSLDRGYILLPGVFPSLAQGFIWEGGSYQLILAGLCQWQRVGRFLATYAQPEWSAGEVADWDEQLI